MKPRSKWVSVPCEGIVDLPRIPACYVIKLYSRERTYCYVGSTQNLQGRFRQRTFTPDYDDLIRTEWGAAESVEIKYKPSERFGDWLMVEARLIRRLKPVLNIRGSVGRKVWDFYKDGTPYLRLNCEGRHIQLAARVGHVVDGSKLFSFDPRIEMLPPSPDTLRITRIELEAF